MSIQSGINLVRNLQAEVFADDPAVGLPINAVLLETADIVHPPYLIIRRGDEIYAPWSESQVMAHVIILEYVIGEGDAGLGQIEVNQDVVARVRRIDEMFMDKLYVHPSYRSTSDVDEGLVEDRVAYLLTRTIEIEADIHVTLDLPGIELVGAVA